MRRGFWFNKKLFLKKVKETIINYPISEDEILEIIELSGRLKALGFIPKEILKGNANRQVQFSLRYMWKGKRTPEFTGETYPMFTGRVTNESIK